jgi:hypothetical protein
MKFDNAPRLPRLPFILSDIALLALAWFIAARHSDPISPLPLFVITGCVVAGIVVLMIPFIVNYARDQEDAATSLRHELGEQFKRLIAASEHLQNSTNQLKTIEEIATKNVQTAERLPSRLQERIAEFNQQLVAAENKDKTRLEQELAQLRALGSERQTAAAGEITQSLASWTEVATGVRQQLATAAELQGKLAVALPDLDRRIAGLQAAVEAAAKAAESIRDALPPPSIALPTPVRLEQVPVEPDPMPVEPMVAAASPVVEEPVSVPAPVVAPDWRTFSERAPSGSEPPMAANSLSTTVHDLSTIAEPTPAVSEPAPIVDPISAVPEVIAPPVPMVPPAAIDAAMEPATAAAPLPMSSPEVAPPSFESPVSASPFASVDQPASPAPSPETSEPFASSKPRKPRAPRKPRTGSTPPVETAAGAGVGSTPPVEIPIARPAPVELIAEPVADELPTPENFSQVPPEENKPVARPSADGRTRLTVVSYIGIGNKLHLRGEGAGLSWSKGVSLQFVSIGRWRWETEEAAGPVTCRIYKNDKLEAPIGPLTLAPGSEQEVSVTF